MICVFFFNQVDLLLSPHPFFFRVSYYVLSKVTTAVTSHRQMVRVLPQPNNSVVVNNKKKFFLVNTFRKMRERENRWSNYISRSVSTTKVYPAKKKKKKLLAAVYFKRMDP